MIEKGLLILLLIVVLGVSGSIIAGCLIDLLEKKDKEGK